MCNIVGPGPPVICNGSPPLASTACVVITIKLEAKRNFRTAAMLLFTLYENLFLTTVHSSSMCYQTRLEKLSQWH
jgi:hypothetical protein